MGARSPEGAHGSSTTPRRIQSHFPWLGQVNPHPAVLGPATPAPSAAAQSCDLTAEALFERGPGPREVVDLVGVAAQVVELALAGCVLHVRVPGRAHAVVVGDVGPAIEQHGVADLAVTGTAVGPGLV